VELSSLLPLGNKSFFRLKVLPTSPGVVLSAENPRDNSIVARQVAGPATPAGQCWVENTNEHIGNGLSKVYGFVQMPSQSESHAAIANIMGKKLKNRVVNVVAALPLSNKDGAAISRTGNNNLSNNRRGEGKYEMI
jgi:RNA recognition motif-containing protein